MVVEEDKIFLSPYNKVAEAGEEDKIFLSPCNRVVVAYGKDLSYQRMDDDDDGVVVAVAAVGNVFQDQTMDVDEAVVVVVVVAYGKDLPYQTMDVVVAEVVVVGKNHLVDRIYGIFLGVHKDMTFCGVHFFFGAHNHCIRSYLHLSCHCRSRNWNHLNQRKKGGHSFVAFCTTHNRDTCAWVPFSGILCSKTRKMRIFLFPLDVLADFVFLWVLRLGPETY